MLATTVGSAPPAATGAEAVVPRCFSGISGDVNGDGYAEVAVGEPGNSRRRGSVHVFYGQRSGLVVDGSGSARNDQYLTQDTPGVPGTAEPGDDFGTSTLLADLNGDGCADLVVGSPGENDSAGWVQVFFGSPSGLGTVGVQSFTVADLPGWPSDAPDQRLGDALAAGDVDGDGVDDLVASAPWLNVGAQQRAGGVAVVYGGRAGLDLKRSLVLTANSPGVPGSAQGFGNFGMAVTTGDFDGNGTTELAISSRDSGLRLGSAQVLSRTEAGFTGPAPIRPDTAGLPGDPAQFCAFGASLASGDVHSDGRDDLVVGVTRFGCTSQQDDAGSSGTGAVVLLPGSPTGLTTARSQVWTQDSPGVQGAARSDADFGSSLALAPLDRNGTADLVVGAPNDGGGSVTVLLGSPAGLTTNGIGGVRYTQSTPGIPGTDEGADSFGSAITPGFVQTPTQATLVVSAPGESVGNIGNAGSITQIPVGLTGPDPSLARTITTNTAGVQGRAQTNDYFGSWH
ncbi:MAG: hypothetical protein ABWY56_06760 [Propionibacteriaceae bacterium]